MAIDQKDRHLSLTTPLGENTLVLTGFQGREEMSRLFEFELDLLSEDNNINPNDIVGANVTFGIKMADDEPRLFNGQVIAFMSGDEDKREHRNYRAIVVPWLWMLTKTSDCRIFQEMTAPDIIEQVFSDLGFSDFEIKANGTHPERTYCVQYRETDFNFVSRLMEEEGMYYYFKHEDGKHTLVVSDQKTGYTRLEPNRIHFPRDTGGRAMDDHITNWERRYEFRTGKWAQTDYNFETPSVGLMSTESTVMSIPNTDKFEKYDYPGVFANPSDGRDLTKLRMEEEEAAHDVVSGTSLVKPFSPGYKFTIGEHKSSSESGQGFVLTMVEHFASEPMAYETGARVTDPYYNRFNCIPDATVFRAQRTTMRPHVQGPQTAVVVGPAGEEIYTDEYGRIKVQFHWDREGEENENSSCWIRVAQFWAGNKWGAHYWPRIGHEVVVTFLEGNPDKPLVIGSVYNDENMPPYELPANQTMSGVKSRSSKGGGDENFNEIRFEDKTGEEQIFVHAERNRDIEVEADETHWVGGNQTMEIDIDRTTTVHGHFSETVENGVDRTVLEGETEFVAGGVTRTVTDSETETIVGGCTRIVADSGETEIVCDGHTRIVASGGETQILVDQETRIVAGNHTEIIAGSMTQIIAGGGTVLSPAGYNVVDGGSGLYSTGPFSGNAYAIINDNFIARLTIGVATDILMTPLQVTVAAAVLDDKGFELTKFGMKIKSGAMNMYNAALTMLN